VSATFIPRAGKGISVVAVVALGFWIGAQVRLAASQTANAQTCSIEQGSFNNTAETIMDTDDGVDEDNRWSMLGGRDFGRSLACADGVLSDRFEGNADNDDIGAGSGSDVVDGGPNNDLVFGGAGGGPALFDQLFGGTGADNIQDVEINDFDTLQGGDGNDTLNADDVDSGDGLNGQAGSDTCFFDPGDSVTSC
jgi:hemolysin type calcium-binding protein